MITVWPPITEGTLIPAPWRKLDTAQQAEQAFLSGLDFTWNHPKTASTYCSIRDYSPGDIAKIRYNSNKDIIFVAVPGREK